MKFYLLYSLSFIFSVISFQLNANNNNYKIIPYPNALVATEGTFFITPQEMEFIDPSVSSLKWKESSKFIYHTNTELNEEDYMLHITPNNVEITSSSETGFFYALQTIQQLLTDEGPDAMKSLPCVSIEDEPRLKYRGLHLDVSRHFRDKKFILKQIDAMSRYKLNRLHWHLTDDAGWRMEIKKYPRLTTFAAWRPYANYMEWVNNSFKFCDANTPNAYGGFYTQDEIREIVKYAADRHITIIPEIEFPGHSMGVLSAYPDLCCEKTPYAGSELCMGNENTFKFMEEVLTEVMALFPSEYIHIGGDEVYKGRWLNCPLCKKRMQEEALYDGEELQSYGIKRIGEFLYKNNRKMIGWDEILQGGLAPGATVMTWQGEEGGIKAVHSCHQAIMTPSNYCYFDSYQDAPHTQPTAQGGYLPLEKVYSYNPVPGILTEALQAYVYGVQGNVWAELIQTDEHMEYMIYPRIFAIAENGWTQPESKYWERFHEVAIREVRYLEQKGYAPFKLYEEVGQRKEARTKNEHLAVGKKVTYHTKYTDNYTAGGDSALVDGWLGDWTYTDGRWQGYCGTDILVTIDLEKETAISEVSAEFLQMANSWVWLPTEVEIFISNNNTDFKSLGKITHQISKEDKSLIFNFFTWTGTETARYIKFKAVNENTPPGSWIMCDEIIVK